MVLVTEVCIDQYMWLGHIYICRYVKISFAIETVEPVRVGIGRAVDPYSPSDLPILRTNVMMPDGRIVRLPVIPGSSLKGVLRTSTMVLTVQAGLLAHSGVGGDDCLTPICGSDKAFEALRKSGLIEELKKVVRGFCPTCLLYGTRSFASRTIVGDFIPRENIATALKTGIAINRRTGTIAHGPFNVEYVEPGSKFYGSIQLRNVPNWLLSLFAASLLAIHSGWFKVGGFKSRGMGRIRIVEDSVRLEIRGVAPEVVRKLDKDIDENLVLEMCREDGGSIVCEGINGFRALEKLASLWYDVYSKKVVEVYKQRLEESRSICQGYALTTSE